MNARSNYCERVVVIVVVVVSSAPGLEVGCVVYEMLQCFLEFDLIISNNPVVSKNSSTYTFHGVRIVIGDTR